MSGLLRETSALRAALRIAVLLGRVLVLPHTCAFTQSSGLVPPPRLVYRDRHGRPDANVLDDDTDAEWCAPSPTFRGLAGPSLAFYDLPWPSMTFPGLL